MQRCLHTLFLFQMQRALFECTFAQVTCVCVLHKSEFNDQMIALFIGTFFYCLTRYNISFIMTEQQCITSKLLQVILRYADFACIVLERISFHERLGAETGECYTYTRAASQRFTKRLIDRFCLVVLCANTFRIKHIVIGLSVKVKCTEDHS